MTISRADIGARLDHVMWPKFVKDGKHLREHAVCSCGYEIADSMWLDDVILTDLRADHAHVNDFVISYPEDTPEQSVGGVMVVVDGDGWPLRGPDLAWLLEQPGLPEEFRRAAAVHLRS